VGVINPKYNLPFENKSVPEKKSNCQGLIDHTYKFGEDRMTHSKIVWSPLLNIFVQIGYTRSSQNL
jgi:hypothetical protein